MENRLQSALAIVVLATLAGPVSRPVLAAAKAAPPIDPLLETVRGLDRTLFDTFNAHQLEPMMASFAEDIEFYHDKSGLETYAVVKAGFEKMFANLPDMHRELVPGTLAVYPLPGWGALETGRHRFCHTENGKQECGTFSFMILWRQTGERWQAARVVSYGH